MAFRVLKKAHGSFLVVLLSCCMVVFIVTTTKSLQNNQYIFIKEVFTSRQTTNSSLPENTHTGLVTTNKSTKATTTTTTTKVSATKAPTSKAPTTKVPATKAPTTKVPATKAPTTKVPRTKAQTTKAPATKAPTTKVPRNKATTTTTTTTKTPTTKAPATKAPTTKVPTTKAPTTNAPQISTKKQLPQPKDKNNLYFFQGHLKAIEKSEEDLLFLKSKSRSDKQHKCPSVLKGMVHGSWKVTPTTTEQTIELKTFLERSRTQHKLPKSLQRDDSMCGNTTFPRHLSPTITFFRALCDPYGATPCCYQNTCRAKSPDECQCKNCFDLRQPPHAEYSDFIPHDRKCRVRKYNMAEACELLDGGLIYFSGDSYLRHMYTALLMFLRNNMVDGALKKNTPKDIQDQCMGMLMFAEKICRKHLAPSSQVTDLCGGKFKVKFDYYYASVYGASFVNAVNSLSTVSKSLVLMGVAIHDGYNVTKIRNKYIVPVVQTIGNHTWPKLLWATPHCRGTLSYDPNHSFKNMLLKFIKQIDDVLLPLHIPTLNTFHMTEGMVSFDGNHYGLGINLWKLQILFNYIQELKDNGNW